MNSANTHFRQGEFLSIRKRQQEQQHPGLTLTGIYNVLEKLRSGEVPVSLIGGRDIPVPSC
jgi:hypothetical protein